jgi:hypothetical protein
MHGMRYKTMKWLGLVLLLEAGVLQYISSQDAFLQAPYLGYVQVGCFLGIVAAAIGIGLKQAWGWITGSVLAAGLLVIFAWSRTIGLPQMAAQPWLYPYGIVSGAADALFIALTLFKPWKLPDPSSAVPPRYSLFLPSVMIVVALIAIPTYQWDVYASEVGYHHHVASLDVVCSTPLTSFADLESKYGLRVSLVAVSMMDGVVDVRLKIIDPEKAKMLLMDQAALLVDQKILVLAPHMHSHARLKQDKIHFIFFPTTNGQIHAGSEVSLVFGAVRVEPVIVQ